jgi:ABC-type multidrug transport system fused ATPase/permease subunit
VRTLLHPGRVELRDVTFGYPGAEAAVLDDVAFTAETGQTVAVIGGCTCRKVRPCRSQPSVRGW